MYQTLYRKYRPNTFVEVVGQEVIIKTLENEIKSEHLNHAYLFTGPRGTGKTTVAKILAKIINCENLNGTTPCNECVNCTQIKERKSTDIIEIDAASNNGIDEIRELKSKINLVPSSGKYKIYIIDEVHMLTIGAFNALLKTLEEPPLHIIFILATTDPHKIPTTILSRCQRFDFKKISLSNLNKRLREIIKQEKISIDDGSIMEIARLSDGGMRDALSILDQVAAFSGDTITTKDVHEVNGTLSQSDMLELLKNIIDRNLSSELNMLDRISDDGKNLVKLTEEFILLLRNILLFKVAPIYFKENHDDILHFENISREIEQEDLIEMIKKINVTLNGMHNSNSPKLLLELIFIELISQRKEILSSATFKNTKNIKEYKTDIITDKKTKSEDQSLPSSPTDLEKTIIVEEKKTIPTDNSFLLFEQLENLISVRINNALSGFNKQELTVAKKHLVSLSELLIDPKYSKYISMILDAELKVAGNKYLVYVYPNLKLANIFNSQLLELEKIVGKHTNIKYKLIAIEKEKWESVKTEYNSKIKKYNLMDETINISDIFPKNSKNKKDKILDLFGELVEYKEEK